MSISTRNIVVAGVLIAVAFVLAITGLGYFPVPNVTDDATIMHVPTIIGSVLEGPVVGLLVGLVFSINAYIRYVGLPFFADQPGWVPVLVLAIPRLFIGIVAWLVYRALSRGNQIVALTMSAIAGSLTNSILVLGLAIGRGLLPTTFIAVALPQIIFEMVIAAIITVAVVIAWKRIDTGKGSSV